MGGWLAVLNGALPGLSVPATGTVATTTSGATTATGDGRTGGTAAPAEGRKEGQRPGRVAAVAQTTLDWFVRFGHGTPRLGFSAAIRTDVFVDRHETHLLCQSLAYGADSIVVARDGQTGPHLGRDSSEPGDAQAPSHASVGRVLSVCVECSRIVRQRLLGVARGVCDVTRKLFPREGDPDAARDNDVV